MTHIFVDYVRVQSDIYDNKIRGRFTNDSNIILCKSISRLARNTADFIRTLDTLHDCGVSIYFEKENIDTTEAVSSFVLTALAALAQEESLSISENLKWANEKRFPAGEVPNLVIYGYRYCKGKNEYSITESGYKMKNIEIVPEEAEVVRHIFTEVAKGKKYVDIARGLNARSIPPPEKRKGENQIGWAGRDIGNIIKSERYVGDVLIQKTVTVDALSHKTVSNSGEAPQYLIHDHHPAIIDCSLFNTVQAIRQRNSESHGNNRGSTRKDQILTGLVKCGCCGKNYNVRGRNRIPTWFCPDAVCKEEYGRSTKILYKEPPSGNHKPGNLGTGTSNDRGKFT